MTMKSFFAKLATRVSGTFRGGRGFSKSMSTIEYCESLESDEVPRATTKEKKNGKLHFERTVAVFVLEKVRNLLGMAPAQLRFR